MHHSGRARGRMMAGWGALLSVVVMLGVMGLARADIIIPDPEGTKRVPATITVDWGPFAERVSVRHVVVKGDTLRGLAKQYYDDVERWTEIRDANEHVVREGDVIDLGAELWVPPRNRFEGIKDESETRHDFLAHRYEAFWVVPTKRIRYLRADMRASPGELPEKLQAGATLLFLKPAGARVEIARLRGEKVEGELGPVLRASLRSNTLVAEEDPTVRIVTHFELTGRNTGSVTTKKTRTRFDADGQEVTEEYPVPKRPGGFRTVRDLPPPDDVPTRWSALVGLVVVFLGLVIVGGGAYAKRRAERSA